MLWSVAAQGGGGACAFAFSPDGTRLVAGFADGRALIMEIATGDVLLELHAGSSKVDAAAFSPDGGSIVAVSAAPGKCTVFEVAATPEVLASRTAQSDARALVDEMTQRLHFSDEIAAALRRASEMDPQLNQAAAQLAAARGDNANQLNSEAWAIARFPGRSAAEYALAVAKARHACAVRQGEHAFQNTLGVSLLRAGDFAEAIETLEGCIEMARAPGQPAHPVDLLALAIAEAKSGDVVAARGRLVAARESLSSGRFAPDPEVDWLLSEAAQEVEQAGTVITPTR
jgi:hypothetical protein